MKSHSSEKGNVFFPEDVFTFPTPDNVHDGNHDGQNQDGNDGAVALVNPDL